MPEFVRPKPHIFWLRDADKRPVACVASIRYDSGDVKFAVATHNPHDQFNKVLGRNKAIGRLFADKELKPKDGHLVCNSNVKKIYLAKDDNPKATVLYQIASDPKRYGITASKAAAYQLGKLQQNLNA